MYRPMAEGTRLFAPTRARKSRSCANFIHLYGRGSFLRRKYISTEAVHFYGGSVFLRRKCISTEYDHFYIGGPFDFRRSLVSGLRFYGGSSFLRRKHSSTEEAHFYRGSQEPICNGLLGKYISTEEAYLFGGGSVLRSRLLTEIFPALNWNIVCVWDDRADNKYGKQRVSLSRRIPVRHIVKTYCKTV